jgi:hypothetical protein
MKPFQAREFRKVIGGGHGIGVPKKLFAGLSLRRALWVCAGLLSGGSMLVATALAFVVPTRDDPAVAQVLSHGEKNPGSVPMSEQDEMILFDAAEILSRSNIGLEDYLLGVSQTKEIPLLSKSLFLQKLAELERANLRELSQRDERTLNDLFVLYRYIRNVSEQDDDICLRLAASLWAGAEKYDLPIGLVIGLTQTESGFRIGAVSGSGACGPMQVMWSIHRNLLRANGIESRSDLFTPEQGVEAGLLVLSGYLRAEKSVLGALRRYYGALRQNYVTSVLSHWHTWELYASGSGNNWKEILDKEKNLWGQAIGNRSRSGSPGEREEKDMTGSGTVARSGTPLPMPGKTTVMYEKDGTRRAKLPGMGSITVYISGGSEKTQ